MIIKLIYNGIDKFIHVRIRMDDDNHIEYDENITTQLIKSYDVIMHKECCYIQCDGVNVRTSLFDVPHDYQTTERVDIRHFSQSSSNILTDLFFENLQQGDKDFGDYFEILVSEYLLNSKELLPYMQEMITLPREQWSSKLYTLNAQWTDVIGMKEFDWLMRLQRNSGTFLWTLVNMYESLELVANNDQVQDEINAIMDAYDYQMIEKMPILGRTWENRREKPVIYTDIDNMKLIVFTSEEYEKLNLYVKGKSYKSARNIIKEKLDMVINLYLQAALLLDFMSYIREILNNNRTFKMQLREAELLNSNYFDYIIREWQSSTAFFKNLEEMKEEIPVLKEIETSIPSITAIINNVLFEKYIYKFGHRYSDNELNNSRIFISRYDERALICIS